eukprot:TRINITY_DN712_c0_g1_i1.p1 TRINITY_DN712_c0_g1~~TRINITY_DN712_c0_g1_i1.p1  ORF type:complete len:1356 (+),score=452.92 TRINITY_DN712_c0_g1_i1:114-4181(+)
MGCAQGVAAAAPRAYATERGSSPTPTEGSRGSEGTTRLLGVLLSAVSLLRGDPDLKAGARELGAVDDLVRLTCAPLLQGYEEVVQQQAARIDALERRWALCGPLSAQPLLHSVVGHPSIRSNQGLHGSLRRNQGPKQSTVLDAPALALTCYRRLCPSCAGTQLQDAGTQTDLVVPSSAGTDNASVCLAEEGLACAPLQLAPGAAAPHAGSTFAAPAPLPSSSLVPPSQRYNSAFITRGRTPPLQLAPSSPRRMPAMPPLDGEGPLQGPGPRRGSDASSNADLQAENEVLRSIYGGSVRSSVRNSIAPSQASHGSPVLRASGRSETGSLIQPGSPLLRASVRSEGPSSPMQRRLQQNRRPNSPQRQATAGGALGASGGDAAQRRLARHLEGMGVLLSLTIGVASSGLGEEQVLCRVFGEARKIFVAELALLYFADPDTGQLYEEPTQVDDAADAAESARGTHSSEAMTGGLVWWFARDAHATGFAVMSNDCSVHAQFDELRDSELRNMLAVPIRMEDTTPAVAVLANAAEDFGAEDMRLSERVALVAAAAVRSSRLYRAAVFQQKKSNVMLDTLHALATADLAGSALPSTIMRTARSIAQADRCALFIVDAERGEFSAHFQARGGEEDVLVMPMDADIAGDVVRTGVPVNLVDAYEDPRFNREIDTITGYRTRSLLCLPVIYENNIVAVAQLINKCGSDRFEHDDIELFESFAVFAGVSLRNMSLYQEMTQQRRTTAMVLGLVQRLSESDIRDIDSVMAKVMQGAKELTCADRCALFLVDEEHNQLCAKVPGTRAVTPAEAVEQQWRVGDDCSDGSCSDASGSFALAPTVAETQEIRVAIGMGIAGTVALTGEACNIPDAYSDSRFNPEVDRRTGYRTRAILCYPILHEGRVVAVAQLINKVDAHGRADVFTAADERLLQVFASFAGITIGNARLYRFVLDAGNRAMDLFNLQQGAGGTAQTSPRKKVRIAPAQVADKFREVRLSADEVALVKTVHFPVHGYFAEQRDAHFRLVPLAAQIFRDAGVVAAYNIDEAMLFRFLATVKGMYRAVPYHNFVHAFDVMQTLYVFLTDCGGRQMLSELDVLCLLMIGLFHDLDHMGLNNSYHLKAETPLGMLSSASGSRSVLEVHHCSVAIEILSDESTNILCTLPEEDRKYVFKVMIHSILATDMSRHGEILADFQRSVDSPYDRDCDEHRLRLIAMLVKAADVSNVCKPFHISRDWGRKVQQEFDWHGEQEKTCSSASLDIRHSLLAFGRGQIGFMTTVVAPMMALLCRVLPGLRPFLQQLERNCALWRRAVQECLLSHTAGCGTDRGRRYRYYYKLAAHAAQRLRERGAELDVIAHVGRCGDAADGALG